MVLLKMTGDLEGYRNLRQFHFEKKTGQQLLEKQNTDLNMQLQAARFGFQKSKPGVRSKVQALKSAMKKGPTARKKVKYHEVQDIHTYDLEPEERFKAERRWRSPGRANPMRPIGRKKRKPRNQYGRSSVDIS